MKWYWPMPAALAVFVLIIIGQAWRHARELRREEEQNGRIIHTLTRQNAYLRALVRAYEERDRASVYEQADDWAADLWEEAQW